MALRQKGLNFFIDDKLDRGGQISESLLKSINGSRVSIIIFSQNYASFSWCLDELVEIIESMKSKGQIVLPVFYKVDPSEVRKQTGGFGEALAKHEAKFMTTKIHTWKEALTTAAGLSSWDLETRKEADLIKDLVQEVLSKVNCKQLLQVAKHPVGIDSQVEAMELGTHGVSDYGVFMVEIYGMGGIGKTTLAKALQKYRNMGGSFCIMNSIPIDVLRAIVAPFCRDQRPVQCLRLSTDDSTVIVEWWTSIATASHNRLCKTCHTQNAAKVIRFDRINRK